MKKMLALACLMIPMVTMASAPFTKMVGKYQLQKNISGTCSSEITVKDEGGNLIDFGIYDSETNGVVFQFMKVNQPLQTWTVTNPMSGNSIGFQSSVSTFQGPAFSGSFSMKDVTGNLLYQSQIEGHFNEPYLSFKVHEINRLNPSPETNRSFECIYNRI